MSDDYWFQQRYDDALYAQQNQQAEGDMTAGQQETLTDVIHSALCGNPDCRRYTAGDPHHAYYQDRAKALAETLEPQVGYANVLPVTRAVLDELI